MTKLSPTNLHYYDCAVTDLIMDKYGFSRMDALRKFVESQTHALLEDAENGMTSFGDTSHNGVYVGVDGISLGKGKFKVDASGNLMATSGTFTGSVRAGSIQYGGSNGTFNAAGLSDGSIGSSKYGGGSVGGGAIAGGAVTNSKIGNSAVSYGKVDFKGTLDQVDINTSNIAALQRGYFGALACTSLVIDDWQIVIESGGRVYAVSAN